MSEVVANINSLESKDSSWQTRYGHRHGYVRLTDDPALPNGRRGRVTIYQRGYHLILSPPRTFILSWCRGGKRHKERVIGDKFDAVRRADEINQMLASQLEASLPGKTDVSELIARYVQHLRRRADAGEISPGTPPRYQSALEHLAAFIRQDDDRHPLNAWTPNRDFVLRFKVYLRGKSICSNGHANTARRLLSAKGIGFIVSSVRAMVRWAVQEGLLVASAVDAFAQVGRDRIAGPSLSSSPITTEDVVRLMKAADLYQLVLFSFHIFHGVRVAEPCWLMIEFFDARRGWIDYRCIEELGYRTKGGVDKRLPLPDPMIQAVHTLAGRRSGGPLLIKRRFAEGHAQPVLPTADLNHLVRKVQEHSPAGWSQRARVARICLKEAGAIDGDDIRREFDRLARTAGIESDATPKALRHHFATLLERADVPYYTRKYLLGHRLGDKGGRGSDITAIYTHLEPDFVRAAYQRVLDGPLGTVVQAFVLRLAQLSDDSMDRSIKTCDAS